MRLGTKRTSALGLFLALLGALFADGAASGGAAGGVRDLMQTAIIGVSVGSIYALVALGLALVYKAQRVFNFAQGEFGTVAVFAAWLAYTGPSDADSWLRGGLGLRPTAALLVASLIGIVVGIALALATEVLVVRKLVDSAPVTTLVATAGVALLVVSLQIIVGEAQPRNLPKLVTGGPTFFGVVVEWQSLLLVGVLAVVALLLALFFRTRTGTALLATAQEPFAAELYGISTRKMALITWAGAGALAAVGGLLAVGFFQTFTPGYVTAQYLVPAFTAAILGGITSMPGAVVGGLLLGVVQASSSALLPSTWPGRPQIGVFVILLAVLLFFPRGLLGKET